MHASCGPHCSMMQPSYLSNGYLRIAHIQVLRWSMVSSQLGACRWNDDCWVRYISWAISAGLVSMVPFEFCMQSSEFSLVG